MLTSFFISIFLLPSSEQISCPWIDLSVVVLISDFEDQINNLFT